MDIKITEKSLRRFLKTKASIEDIIEQLCNSGPTVDRFRKVGDDTILEIEIITNRVDSASVFGVAREANAILNQNKIESCLENNPYNHQNQNFVSQTGLLNFATENPELIKRFTAISIDGVTVTESPVETKELLEKTGQRPINNLVDATNEATLLYGIPSHVFDKDKLALQKLIIREAKSDETVTTLDGDKLTLLAGDIVIEDGQGRLVDLCGVMGGQVAEVDEHSKNIILIVPIYNPQKIRKTSLAHQKRTLAAQIYEKGPDPELCLPVLDLLTKMIIERAGGSVSSKVIDIYNLKTNSKDINLNLSWLNSFAGANTSNQEAISILENLGFTNTKVSGEILTTSVPGFRAIDINTREDLAEEIVRIYGYYKITATLPPLNQTPVSTSNIFALERKVKTTLADSGFNEVYNSSLISKSLIESCNLDPKDHLKLTNCLSEDLEYLRTSLTPNALQNHANNKGKSGNTIKLFELANIYIPDSKNNLPNEISTLIFSSNISILELKLILEKLFIQLNYATYKFTQPSSSDKKYFDAQNSADIYLNNQIIGQIGEIKTSILRSFGIQGGISLVELNISELNKIKPTLVFQPISEYPSLIEDITITSTNPIGEIIDQISSQSPDIKKVSYKNSFKNNHSFEITIGSNTQNLTKSDADLIRTQILKLFS